MSDPAVSDDARQLAVEVRRLAHDLNNALMPILLASSTIRMAEAAADPAILRKIEIIERSARRASDVVTELQTLAREIVPPGEE